MRFKSISDILDHIHGKFSHMIWIGKEYSIADLIADMERLSMRADNEIARTNAVLDRLIERGTPIADLSPEETVQRLRSHVRLRGGPTLDNGAWALMLHAADLLEDLHRDLLVGPVEIVDSFPSTKLCDAFYGKKGACGVPAERLAEHILDEREDEKQG